MITKHYPDDGGGNRRVLVDGKPVDHVFFADTRAGIVDYYPYPFQIHKHRKRVISRRLRGRVEVLPIIGPDNV